MWPVNKGVSHQSANQAVSVPQARLRSNIYNTKADQQWLLYEAEARPGHHSLVCPTVIVIVAQLFSPLLEDIPVREEALSFSFLALYRG